MQHLRLTVMPGLLALAVVAGVVRADASPQDLGKSLTPMGAEKAGNAAGTIPAWDGGLTQCPPGHKPGDHYPNPFPQDAPLLNAENNRPMLIRNSEP